ncbi:MAG TPA: thymidine kinase [Firmicutes bacterium]|nr:thymidine kinase [Bacillota bacterium]
MAGRIELITGPMFSGKTTELLMRKDYHQRSIVRSTKVLVPTLLGQKEWIDLETHDGRQYQARCCADLEKLFLQMHDHKCKLPVLVSIDEVQFFPPEVVPVIERAAREWGWTIICAGLLLDFKNEAWATTTGIYDIADTIISLRARCTICGALADRTQRLHLDGTPARADEPRIVVDDGSVRYEPRCWRCHVVGGDKGAI